VNPESSAQILEKLILLFFFGQFPDRSGEVALGLNLVWSTSRPLRAQSNNDAGLETIPENGKVVDVRGFKAQLRKCLPPDNLVLLDLLSEPDTMQVGMAEVLIPHYLERLERELKRRESGVRLTLRA
jgi:hypothetical protein